MKKIIVLMLMSVSLMMADNLLKAGTYSWHKGGATASLTVKKDKANGYGIVGDALYGMSRKYGPNLGDLSFTGFMKNGKLVYTEGKGEDKYTLILKVRKDGSFDISEEGLPPFGHNVSFAGHFTSDDKPSFLCSKARTFTEKAICDNKGLARLDRKMARAYSLLKSGFFYKENGETKVNALKKEQRAWGKQRNACAKQKAYLSCYERSYFERIKILDQGFEGLWTYKE
ncbi:MAG: Unknown protein [uncultured Sulfurovum sp.]|uniref:Lysozyme inhibitor LprI-like N-terminal domain-containing protein n=1 Tax=uncultured Sulfurovum sp. TaxID=269237 RepID=A0A6S6S0G7_9BACT|nr:MAG: Unknown protein [uncultured Sulfurovum sp.]